MDDLVIPREILFFHICPYLDLGMLGRLARSCREFWMSDWPALLRSMDRSKIDYENFAKFKNLHTLRLRSRALKRLQSHPKDFFLSCTKLETLELIQTQTEEMIVWPLRERLFAPLHNLRRLRIDFNTTRRYSTSFLHALPVLQVFETASTCYYQEPHEMDDIFPSIIEFHCTCFNYALVYKFPSVKKLVIEVGRAYDIPFNTSTLAPLPASLETLELHGLLVDQVTARWAPSVQTIRLLSTLVVVPFDGKDFHSLRTVECIGIIPGLISPIPRLQQLKLHVRIGDQMKTHVQTMEEVLLPSYFNLRPHILYNIESTVLVQDWIRRHRGTLEQVVQFNLSLDY